jgi:hypothetical protein
MGAQVSFEFPDDVRCAQESLDLAKREFELVWARGTGIGLQKVELCKFS